MKPKAPWTRAFPAQAAKLRQKAAGRVSSFRATNEGKKMDMGKNRKRIRSATPKRARELARYRREAAEFLKSAIKHGGFCPVSASMPQLRIRGASWKLTEVHHIRGRCGSLLLDKRFWMAVSKDGHRWIHDHPDTARDRGWLATEGQWNTVPKERAMTMNTYL